MKIITWNIKGEAFLGWNMQYKIESKLVDKIIKQEADVIILTAFVMAKGIDYLFERFENEEYVWFQQTRTGKNGVLIAIKRNLINEGKCINQIYNNNAISSVVEGCNILKVTVPMKSGKNLCIIGCRMETGRETNLQKQYDNERKVFDEILIPTIHPVNLDALYIVSGDFNNARCLGNLEERFNSSNYLGKAQCNYNLNIIKDTFDDIGFEMVDVGKNGEPILTYKNFPLDHIFTYGLKTNSVAEIDSDNLSDHKILWAEVELKQI